MVTLTIDGRRVEVDEGSTILEAARKAQHSHSNVVLTCQRFRQ